MKSSSFAVVAACAAVLLTGPGSLRAPAPANASAPRPAPAIAVGVVDVTVLFEQSPLWQRLNKELKEKQKQFGEQVQKVITRIDELEATAKQLPPDSMEFASREMEIGLLRQQRTGMSKLLRDQLDLEIARAQLQCYQVFEKVIAKVATARGLAFVLRRREVEPPTVAPEKMSSTEVLERLRGFDIRQVLFNAPELDITADVVKELRLLPDPAPAGGDPTKPTTPNQGDK